MGYCAFNASCEFTARCSLSSRMQAPCASHVQHRETGRDRHRHMAWPGGAAKEHTQHDTQSKCMLPLAPVAYGFSSCVCRVVHRPGADECPSWVITNPRRRQGVIGMFEAILKDERGLNFRVL